MNSPETGQGPDGGRPDTTRLLRRPDDTGGRGETPRPPATIALPRPRGQETRPLPFQRRGRKRRALVRTIFGGLGWALLAVYGLVTRFAVAVGAVWGLLYFGLASSWSAATISAEVSAALPGTATLGTLRWGPAPWKLSLTHPEIRDPAGRRVIGADAVQVELGLSRTLWSLASWLDDSSGQGVTLYVARAHALRPVVTVAEDGAGGLGLLRAFTAPDARTTASKTAPEHGFGLELTEALVVDGEARIELEAVRLRATGVHGRTGLSLRPREGLAFAPGTVTVDAFALWLHGLAHAGEVVRLAAHGIAVEGFRWHGERFAWTHVTAGVGESLTERLGWLAGAGGMDLGVAPIAWWGDAEVHLTAPLDAATRGPVARLTRGLADGQGSATVAGRGTLEAVEATWTASLARARVGPLFLDEVSASGRFAPRADATDDDVHAVLVDEATFGLAGGRVGLDGMAWEPTGSAQVRSTRQLALAWRADGVAGETVAGLLGLPRPLVGIVARGEGALRVATALSGDTALEIDVAALDAEVKADETSDFGAAPWLGVHRLSGVARYVFGPPEGGLAPLSRLTLSRVLVDRGEDRLRVAGVVDFGQGQLDLEPYLRLGDVATTVRAVGLADVRGRVVLKAMRVTGPLAAPVAAGTLNWTRAGLGAAELAQVKGRVRFADGWLGVEELASSNGLGELTLAGRVRLTGPGSETLPFEVSRARLARFALGRFLPEVGTEARLDLTASALEGEAMTLPASLRGELALALSDAVLGGERVARLTGEVALTQAAIAVREVEAHLAPPRGDGQARAADSRWMGALTVERASGALDGALRVGPTQLGALRALQVAVPLLSGRVEADLTVRGTVDAPEVRGVVGLRDLQHGEVTLGSGELDLAPHPAGGVAVEVRAGGFIPGLGRATARLALDGLAPVGLEAEVTTDRFDPASVMAHLGSEQFRASITATARARMRFGRGDPELTLEAPASGIRLAAPARGRSWENGTPLLVTSNGREASLQPVGIGVRGGTAAPVELCGRVSPEAVDLRVAGLVDLAFIPGLDEVLSTAEGALAIVDAPGGDEDRGTCFYGPRPALELSGRPGRVTISGAVEPRGVAIVPRGTGQALRLRDGGRILLRSDVTRDVAVLTIPEQAPLRADLDEGAVRLHGAFVLRDLRPTSADLALLATDVVARAAGTFELSASIDGRLVASELDGESPDVRLSGRVDIGEGRFFKSFDVLSEALGGAFGGRGDVYARSALDGLPWLRTARLDLEVAAPDLLITSALPLARTNLPARLDLSVRGTVERPELFRRVDLTPGGQLTYLVFERTFRIVSGAVDFNGPPETPFIDITAQTPVTWLARASTDTLDEDQREVTVTLRVLGRVPDLKVELSANDGTLDQADIQALLITGKPRGDLDRAEESRVVSADLATVLNGVLAAPFLRTASVGVGQKGALEYRVGTCLAPNLCFDTTTIAADSETTLRARFSLALGDQLVCEGMLRRSDATTATNQQTYQARCRYRIPLR